ncbi:MAG: tetratricopeptide repeat protein [Planctomycetota bacterium]
MSFTSHKLTVLGCLFFLPFLFSACSNESGQEKDAPERARKYEQKYRQAAQESNDLQQQVKAQRDRIDHLSQQLMSQIYQTGALREELTALTRDNRQWEQKCDGLQSELRRVEGKRDDRIIALSHQLETLGMTLEQAGQHLLEKGEYKEALKTFRPLSRVQPAAPAILYRMAYCHQELNSQSDAAETYRRAINVAEQHPDSNASLLPRLYNNYGVVLMGMERHDDALKWYQKATEITDNYSPVYYNMGKLYMDHLSTPQKAIAAFRRHIATGGNRMITAQRAIKRLQKESGNNSR